jgi:hypothetical protein
MDSLFDQTGGIGLDRAAMLGGLARERGATSGVMSTVIVIGAPRSDSLF